MYCLVRYCLLHGPEGSLLALLHCLLDLLDLRLEHCLLHLRLEHCLLHALFDLHGLFDLHAFWDQIIERDGFHFEVLNLLIAPFGCPGRHAQNDRRQLFQRWSMVMTFFMPAIVPRLNHQVPALFALLVEVCLVLAIELLIHKL